MDVTDSDHKPVRCIFNVEIARVNESVRRKEFGEIIQSNKKIKFILRELCKVPETVCSTNNIILLNQDISILRITNKCGRDKALFEIVCEGQSTIKDNGQAMDHQPRGSFGFPRWLEVISYFEDFIIIFFFLFSNYLKKKVHCSVLRLQFALSPFFNNTCQCIYLFGWHTSQWITF